MENTTMLVVKMHKKRTQNRDFLLTVTFDGNIM